MASFLVSWTDSRPVRCLFCRLIRIWSARRTNGRTALNVRLHFRSRKRRMRKSGRNRRHHRSVGRMEEVAGSTIFSSCTLHILLRLNNNSGLLPRGLSEYLPGLWAGHMKNIRRCSSSYYCYFEVKFAQIVVHA